jgi:hypothetical protein
VGTTTRSSASSARYRSRPLFLPTSELIVDVDLPNTWATCRNESTLAKAREPSSRSHDVSVSGRRSSVGGPSAPVARDMSLNDSPEPHSLHPSAHSSSDIPGRPIRVTQLLTCLTVVLCWPFESKGTYFVGEQRSWAGTKSPTPEKLSPTIATQYRERAAGWTGQRRVCTTGICAGKRLSVYCEPGNQVASYCD